MSNLYNVVYARENGLRRTARVWSKDSSVAVKRVKGRDDVDHIVRVKRTSGALLLAVLVAALGIVVAATPVMAAILD